MLSRFLSATRCTRHNLFQSRHASTSQRPNNAIIEMLNRHKDEEEQSPDKNGYKVRAFANAIKAIQQLNYPLRTGEDALKLRGVGVGIMRRITDFMATEQNALPDTVLIPHDEAVKSRARVNLQYVQGIGRVKAQQLVDAGCMSAADLLLPKFAKYLSRAQKVGFKYMEHLRQPVSREEAELVREFMQANLSSEYEIIITGDYRRGAATSADIDILLLHPDHVHVPMPPSPAKAPKRILTRNSSYVSVSVRDASPLFHDVLPALTERGLIVTDLPSGMGRWQGVIRLPEKNEQGRWGERRDRLAAISNNTGSYRRLSLNLVPMKSRGAALLDQTGDIVFNRDTRMRAAKLGLQLNEFGLWKWNPSKRASRVEDGNEADDGYNGFWELRMATTEEEILRELGMEYIEPEKRNFAFLLKSAARVPKRKI